jgi:hypothetical protein
VFGVLDDVVDKWERRGNDGDLGKEGNDVKWGK